MDGEELEKKRDGSLLKFYVVCIKNVFLCV